MSGNTFHNCLIKVIDRKIEARSGLTVAGFVYIRGWKGLHALYWCIG